MAYKDPEKQREYECKRRLLYRKTHPQVRKYYAQDSYHDFETHRELAINSGIRTEREWYECHKIGLFPDGIYQNPNTAFRRK